MIGDKYWATGITVTHHDGRWSASVTYLDNGFANDSADDQQVSTKGTLHTRYFLRDGETRDALTVAIDVVKADAERLGIVWRGIPKPFLFVEGDGEDPGMDLPPYWRELLDAQAQRLGWESPCSGAKTVDRG